MSFPEQVKIVEVGPRDGLQNESVTVPAEIKVQLVEKLADAGLPVIEVGAFVSPKWVPQMATSSDVFQQIDKRKGVSFPMLVPNLKGLELAHAALAMLAFAISPFVQLMHMVGKVDHHFIEFTFVLLVTWLGLRWFSAAHHRATAIGLGLVLGLAPGFHNGLFILQIPVLLCVGLMWLRGEQLPRRNLHALALTLVASTLLIVLPSEPFQQGLFEFGLLSWFHLYVAACTSVVLVFVGWRKCDKKSLLTLTGVCFLLAIPLIGQLTHGAAFLSRDVPILRNVIEATRPFTLFFEQLGPLWTVKSMVDTTAGAPFPAASVAAIEIR